ncbi:uncharacterized protein LOC122756803 [Drosophila mojavensis]|uniref:uncharacterized protein LOC122756803 n=1 Tax=Drosophila mojavensis TaxID=7230 RepID=UPI001CD111E7|nr:uncharacterized protein LOC122756803 [Drosophila mojavensis]
MPDPINKNCSSRTTQCYVVNSILLITSPSSPTGSRYLAPAEYFVSRLTCLTCLSCFNLRNKDEEITTRSFCLSATPPLQHLVLRAGASSTFTPAFHRPSR